MYDIHHPSHRNAPHRRAGAVIPLLALLSIPLIGLLSFSIDFGFLTVVRAEMQKAADAAVLAGVVELIPDPDGYQDLAAVRATVRHYVQDNLADTSFTVLDEDIEIGRYDETTIYSGNVVLHSDGILDAVRVTLRRDSSANDPINLFFANLLGTNSQEMQVTATAVLRRTTGVFRAGVDVLPYAVPQSFWQTLQTDDEFSIYDGAYIEDEYGNRVPGNWGTVDLGYEDNSTADLSNQIVEGLRESDIQELYDTDRIDSTVEVTAPLWVNAEPGLSVGQKAAVRAVHGQTRIIPIFDSITGDPFNASGNGGEFHIVAWGVVEVLDSNWTGTKNTYVSARVAYTYDGALVAKEDLSDKSSPIPNAFTSPVLIQ